MKSSTPTIVSAASNALVIAPSVACAVARKRGVSRSLSSMRTVAVESLVHDFALAVEKAMKMSPEELPPKPPWRPMPSATRLTRRSSWCGRSGASVATTTMIEPCSSDSRGGGALAPQRGTPRWSSVGMAAP